MPWHILPLDELTRNFLRRRVRKGAKLTMADETSGVLPPLSSVFGLVYEQSS